jgi:hypothetical protein
MQEPPAGRPRDPALERAQARALFIGIAAAIITLPLALYAHRLAVDPYHTPLLASEGRLLYLGTLLAAGVTGWLASRNEAGARASADWALPAVTVGAALWIAGAYHHWPATLAAPVLAGSGVFIALLLRYLRDEGPASAQPTAALGETLLTNLVGFVAFSMLLLHHSPVKFGAPAVLLVGALLGIATLGSGPRAIAYALIIGLALAETTWALSYWQATGWELGAIAQAIWYGLATAAAAQLRGDGTLNRANLARHGGLAAAICLVVAIIAT